VDREEGLNPPGAGGAQPRNSSPPPAPAPARNAYRQRGQCLDALGLQRAHGPRMKPLRDVVADQRLR
jgi:hypothetical protein